MARDAYGHAGLLTMVRELVGTEAECREIGARLWSLADTVEACERQALSVETLTDALEPAIGLESSALDVLGQRLPQSVEAELPAGVARSFSTVDMRYRRLAEAADRVADPKLQRRLASLSDSRSTQGSVVRAAMDATIRRV